MTGWDVITHSFSDFNCGLTKPSFMLEHGYIHINNGFLSISSFPSTSINKKDPRLLSIKTTVLWLHVHHYHTRYSTDDLHLVNAFSSEHKITATLHPTPCNAITHATKQPLATSFTPDRLDHTHDLWDCGHTKGRRCSISVTFYRAIHHKGPPYG